MKKLHPSTFCGLLVAAALCAVVAIVVGHPPGAHLLSIASDPGSLLMLAAAAPAAVVKQVRARVLVDAHNLKVNDVVEGDAEQIKQLVKAGTVDDSKAAVTYALDAADARVVKLSAASPDPDTQKTPEQIAAEEEAERLRLQAQS